MRSGVNYNFIQINYRVCDALASKERNTYTTHTQRNTLIHKAIQNLCNFTVCDDALNGRIH